MNVEIETIDPRPMLLKIARDEIGYGEEGGNNQGPDIVTYRRGRGGDEAKGPWCGDFVSWCIEETWAAFAMLPPVHRTPGAKRLYRRVGKAGAFIPTSAVEAGDLVCWHRGKDGSGKGHIGIVEAVLNPGVIQTIEGNVGAFPAKVRFLKHDVTHERLVGFARLPLITKERKT